RSTRPRARRRARLDQCREHLRARPRRAGAPARGAAQHGPPGRGAPAADGPGRPHRHDEAPLLRLLDPQPLDLARGRHRRPRPDRRPRVPAARPRAPRPARRPSARRRRRLGARRLPPARARQRLGSGPSAGAWGGSLFSESDVRRERLRGPGSMSAARGLLRFWWLVVLGLAAGVVGAGALISHEPPTIYTANDTVLVNSADAPYLRTVQPAAPVTTASKSSSKKKKQATVKSTTPAPTPPDTQVLVNAANLYPLFMQSDEI